VAPASVRLCLSGLARDGLRGNPKNINEAAKARRPSQPIPARLAMHLVGANPENPRPIIQRVVYRSLLTANRMCGILELCAGKVKCRREFLARAQQSLAHRDPTIRHGHDDLARNPAALASRTPGLSIIDLSPLGISPCKIRSLATGSYSTARSKTSANFAGTRTGGDGSRVIPTRK